mmetsp:Transcript_47338/g.136772  ORF Transcript_47338/g.136772 Transcript_47338/m.136772 type:complete len:316 (-) Transcript_47338:168-1115(-)
MLYASLLGRDHVDAAGQAAQGTLHVLVQGLGLACLGLLGKQLAETHACLLKGLERHGTPGRFQLNGGQSLRNVLLHKALLEELHRLLVRSRALQDHEAVLLLLCARHDASYGALRRVLALGRAHDDEYTGLSQALCQLEGINGVEVVHLHRDVRSGEAVGEDLGEALTLTVVAHPEDGGRRPEVLHGLLAPGPVVFNPLERVLSKHGAVPGSNGVEIHVFGLLQCVDHGAGVGLHEAVVIQLVVGQQLLDALFIHKVVRAIVHSKCITSVQEPGAVVVGEHCVWPVKVGSDDKLQLMATPQVELVAVSYHLALEW